MLTERAIINALIIGASLILVLFVISSTLTTDYALPLFFGALIMLGFSFFYLKDNLSLCPLLATAIGGRLNFLPLAPEWPQIASLLLILYYIIGYVFIRQKRITVGKIRFFWPILILTL